MRVSVIGCVVLFGSQLALAQLNDSGQVMCSNGKVAIACDALSSEMQAKFPGQDATVGADALADGKLKKTGSGVSGFDFSLLDSTGKQLPPKERDLWVACQKKWGRSCDAQLSIYDDLACAKDNVTGLVWQAEESSYIRHFLSLTSAQQALDAINRKGLCGFTDWRFPTTTELLGIVDFNSSDPAIDDMIFSGTRSDNFWTADTPETRWESRRVVNLSNGSTSLVAPSKSSYFRFVRGFAKRTAYVPGTQETLSDASTGLLWDTCTVNSKEMTCNSASRTLLTWSQALQIAQEANTRNYKGYSDWRLPNVKELQSITMNVHGGCPKIDTSAFPNTPCLKYWSSTFSVDEPSKAWVFDFNDGNVGTEQNDRATAGVRLVRGSMR